MSEMTGVGMLEATELKHGDSPVPKSDAQPQPSAEQTTKSSVLELSDMLPPPPSATASVEAPLRFGSSRQGQSAGRNPEQKAATLFDTVFGAATAKTESNPFASPESPDKQRFQANSAGSAVLKGVDVSNLDKRLAPGQAVLPPLVIDAAVPKEIGAAKEADRPAESIHSRTEVLKALKPADRDMLEVLTLERAAASHPDEIKKKDKVVRDFLTDRLGTSISAAGWTSVLEAVTLKNALKAVEGRNGADGRPFTEHIEALIMQRASTSIPDRTKFAEFASNMAAFKMRAKLNGYTDFSVVETLLNVSRVLDPQTRTKHGDPQLIARGMMRNAADPTSIDQGGHNTCNVTTLECRMYTREPQAATKVVADVVINGEFKTADGTIVRPRTLVPDGEALADPTPDGSRNYASQVFQITAINVHWNRRDTLPGGKEAGKGNISYCQGGPGEPAEYLLNCSKMPPEIHRFSTIDSSHPWMDLNGISDVNEQITGRPSSNFGIERWYVSGENRGCFKVSSLQEFKDRLEKMAQERAFPVVLVVDAAKKPIGSGDGGFGPHVVTITNYDPVTGMLTIDNQWGKGADMTDIPGQRGRVSAADMFDNMSLLPSSDFIWNHIKTNIKGLGPTDAIRPGLAALSVKGLRYGMFGSAPSLIHTGLEHATRHGLPGSAAALAAAETRLGRIGLRTGTALGAVGIAFLANDLRSAFKEGTAHGMGKLTRVGVNSMSYELGALSGAGLARLTTLSRWAPGRTGLMIAGGLVVAAALDRVAGESIEIGGSMLYENVRDSLKEWWRGKQ